MGKHARSYTGIQPYIILNVLYKNRKNKMSCYVNKPVWYLICVYKKIKGLCLRQASLINRFD